MSIRKEPNSGLAERIKVLRQEKGYNQSEFALDFSRYIGRNNDYSLTTISAWELGRKTPSLQVLYKLSDYFGCSIDYICGKTNIRNGKADDYTIDDKTTEERDLLVKDSILELKQEDYRSYDKMPVFVTFKNLEYKNQWALLDYEDKQLLFFNEIIPLGKYPITLYVYPLPNEMYMNFWKIHAYSYPQLMQASRFWIEIYSNDDELRGKYNGWYTHNEDRSAIINVNNGLTLPYSGLSVSYVAYHTPSVNS